VQRPKRRSWRGSVAAVIVPPAGKSRFPGFWGPVDPTGVPKPDLTPVPATAGRRRSRATGFGMTLVLFSD
jgi:hypothetical protein